MKFSLSKEVVTISGGCPNPKCNGRENTLIMTKFFRDKTNRKAGRLQIQCIACHEDFFTTYDGNKIEKPLLIMRKE